MAYDYDVTVIGGGPGGYVAAIRAGKLGKKTCLIEADKLGGTCLNAGCIPAKTFVKSAELLRELHRAESFGLTGSDFDRAAVDMKKLVQRKQAVTRQLVGGINSLLLGNHVTIKHAAAAFEDAHTVVADGQKITSEYFILATGSENFIPSSIKIEGENTILTNVEILDLDQTPASMTVLGGGVIGIEFAYIMNSFGCKVTVIEMTDRILPMVDEEISAMSRKRLEKDGVKFYLNAKISRICDNTVFFRQDGEEKSVKSGTILAALGRKPNIDGLNLEAIGVHTENRAVVCDNTLQTTVPNIYAVGDINGKMMLAGTASHEGITAANNICGSCEEVNYNMIPSCAYMVPEIACVGLTEAKARELYGDSIKVGRFPAYANGRSLTEGETDGMFKVIVDSRFGEVLGVHLYGNHVTEMISEFALAMSAEAGADEILKITHPHPTVNESLGEMVMSAWAGGAIHSM